MSIEYNYVKSGVFAFGDCLEVMADMPENYIDCIVTDPAYRTISGGTESEHVAGWKISVLKDNNGKIFKHNNVEIKDYVTLLYKVLKPGCHCYIMTNNLNLKELLNVGADVGFSFHNLLAWQKNTVTANRWYMKNLELTCFFYKKPAKGINDKSSKQTFKFNNPRNKLHPTEKPVELMEHYILNSSAENELILDPFAGSGTTAIACENNKRKWICIEKDAEYAVKAMERIKDHGNGSLSYEH